MARGALIGEWVRRRSCSYRRTAVAVCCLNLVAAVYVLRSLYTSYYAFASASTAASDSRKNAEQLKRMEESIQIRRAFEPIELLKQLKGLEKDLSAKAKNWKLSRSMKQRLVEEVLQRLRELGPSANMNEQLDALESWRRIKLQEIKGFGSKNVTINVMSLSESKILKKALKSNLHVFLEDIGLYIPGQITNKIDDNAGEDPDEEEIIPGPRIPPECHAELHTDYAGAAVRWGLTHHKASAAECCQACLDQANEAKPGELKCNIWVYCPSEGGCYSPDKYEHKHQECWLKQAVTPKLNFKDKYSDSYRSWHPTAPIVVPWISGVIGP